jgi:hypothetical protein
MELTKINNDFFCDFCKKKFATKSNLSLHQKTAKYCLDLRGNSGTIKFECEYCSKSFSNNNRLTSHYSICKSLKEKQISAENMNIKFLEKQVENLSDQLKDEKLVKKQMRDEINSYKKQLEEERERCKQLQETIAKIAMNSKGTTTTHIVNNSNSNNNNTYTLNLNDSEAMSKFLEENLDKNVVGGGQKALANLISNKYLKAPNGKDLYICTDPSRQTFEFVNIDGHVEKDIKANKLKRALIEGKVHTKAAEIGTQLWTKEDGSYDSERQSYYVLNVMEIMNIENDDQKFRGELAILKSV